MSDLLYSNIKSGLSLEIKYFEGALWTQAKCAQRVCQFTKAFTGNGFRHYKHTGVCENERSLSVAVQV